MAVRLQFVPGREPPDLLELPWSVPLGEWHHERMVRMAHGTSRHVVRFVSDGERVYALKEMPRRDAEHEYRMLRLLAAHNLPVVEAVGLVTERETTEGIPLDPILITRYLDYSLPFNYLFSVEGGQALGRRLLDSGVVLLVRLHLDGCFWGDCSLSNLLFRRDAGALMAYLVDAETAEQHDPPLSPALRDTDLSVARENIAGGLFDLQASGRLPADIDVVAVVDLLEERYTALWEELTATHEADADDRHAIERRVRRLNDLGFDVEELVVEHDAPAARLHVTPALVEEGHHSRELRRLTGLEVQENQARRLLNDIASYGAYLSRAEGRDIPQAVAAARWIAEVFEPLVAQIPVELRGRLEPAELFHELLEHRYYRSEDEGHEVDNSSALRSYIDSVLRFRPDERLLLTHDDQDGAAQPSRDSLDFPRVNGV
ncbi:MAG: hypothetical protein JWL83_2169 [Actinomycetia bacterium]|nr:hypothetical protein [Actinomycetes bacterium]